MDQRDFGEITKLINAVWKNTIVTKDEAEAWFNSMKRYSYETIRQACEKYIQTGSYTPKPADIIGAIPKARNDAKFDRNTRFEFINGKRVKVCQCQRCQDSGMITWEDENQCTVGLPCDCPAGHYYYHWGWITFDEQQEYITKNGNHGETVGENWYLMQPEAMRRAGK